MLTFLLYAVAIAAVAAVLMKVHSSAVRLDVPPLLSVCIAAGTLFYLASLIPGALSALTPAAVGATLVLLSVLTFGALTRLASIARPSAEPLLRPRSGEGLINVLAPATPVLLYYGLRLYGPWHRIRDGLSWDSVSYHLPGFVEFYQARSLYSLDGPYQTYSFAFDLIGGFPGYFFRHHWGVFIAHVYAVVFLLAALRTVTGNVLKIAGQRHHLLDTVTYFGAVSMLVWVFHPEIFRQVGMADIFVGACILAAGGLLLDVIWRFDGISLDARFAAPLVLSSLALALAIATKSTTLVYLPLVPLAFGLLFLERTSLRVRGSWAPAAVVVAASLLGALGVGGFFIFRNLVVLGTAVAPEVAAWNLSILANAWNPSLYAPQRASLVFLASMFAPLGLWLIRGPASPKCRTARRFAVSWSLIALAGFIASPYVIIYTGPVLDGLPRWELRQSVTVFALMSVAAAAFASTLLGRVRPGVVASPVRRLQPLSHATRLWARSSLAQAVPLAGAVAFGVFAVAGPALWQPARGLPGFDTVAGLPRTRIYEWVQGIDQPTRIYAAGLRPYGLYGRAWQHRVFYDLHSAVLLPEASGKARLASVLVEFQPDLLLISVDALDQGPAIGKPLVAWLRSEPACFDGVFEDAAVAAFRVRPGCADRMKSVRLPGRLRQQAGLEHEPPLTGQVSGIVAAG